MDATIPIPSTPIGFFRIADWDEKRIRIKMMKISNIPVHFIVSFEFGFINSLVVSITVVFGASFK